MTRWISPDYDAEWERHCGEEYLDDEYENEIDDGDDFDWNAYENERIQHEIDSIYEGTLTRVFG